MRSHATAEASMLLSLRARFLISCRESKSEATSEENFDVQWRHVYGETLYSGKLADGSVLI